MRFRFHQLLSYHSTYRHDKLFFYEFTNHLRQFSFEGKKETQILFTIKYNKIIKLVQLFKKVEWLKSKTPPFILLMKEDPNNSLSPWIKNYSAPSLEYNKCNLCILHLSLSIADIFHMLGIFALEILLLVALFLPVIVFIACSLILQTFQISLNYRLRKSYRFILDFESERENSRLIFTKFINSNYSRIKYIDLNN